MHSLSLIQSQIEAACGRAHRSPDEVMLIGASKTVDATQLEPFFVAGLRNFGENYLQEGTRKIRAFDELKLRPTWHLIGSLQSNKAREAVANFDLIHSVDRLSLAKELDKEARRIGKTQRVLVQVNIGEEQSKAGVSVDQLAILLDELLPLQNLRVEGLMSLPPFREDAEESRPFHRQLRQLRDGLDSTHLPLPTLSMGMSRDFQVAIEEGATMVRIGTALFGTRS